MGIDRVDACEQAYLCSLKSQFEVNLEFFKSKIPAVAAWIEEAGLLDVFHFEDGCVVIDCVGEKGVFLRSLKCHYSDLYRQGLCFSQYTAVDTSYLENVESLSGHGDFSGFFTYIEPKARRKILQDLKGLLLPGDSRNGSFNYGKNFLPLALCFGDEIGWLVNKVVDDWDVCNLVLIFDDVKKLYSSMFFVDYYSIYKKFLVDEGSFSIIFGQGLSDLAVNIRKFVWGSWPPYILQGAGIFFAGVGLSGVKEVWRSFANEVWLLFRGWGFIDDEMLGLHNSVLNSLANYPVYKGAPNIPEDAVAVVVGNGPSLDSLAEVVRGLSSSSIIISCGSSITALARLGIKPDIHFEIERTRMTYSLLVEPATKSWVENVPIVALSIMPSGVFELTDRPLMLLKQTDVGSFVCDFFSELPRVCTTPTCTNGGVAFALNVGFKKICLVGVDFGFLDNQYHHSKSSIYHCDVDNPSEDLELIIKSGHDQAKDVVSVPGNFRDIVLSTDSFIFAKNTMEQEIERFPDSVVYNMCDGALIKGAVPCEDVSGFEFFSKKEEVLNLIFSAFSVVDVDVKRNLCFLRDQVISMCDDVFKISRRQAVNKKEVVRLFLSINYYVMDPVHLNAQISPLIRGGFFHLGRAFYDGLGLIKDESKALEFWDCYLQVLRDVFDGIISGIEELIVLAEAKKEVA